MKNLYNPFEDMKFSYDYCFLCGEELKDSKSNEDIFPKWLLKRYNLWNEKLTLLNQTKIPYNKLKIPCCLECNNEYLSQMEQKVSKAVISGYESFQKLDELVIYQWILKIFYGILFKELSLNSDITVPNSVKIFTPKLLEEYMSLHIFLQSLRLNFRFEGFTPWSIIILKSHSYEDKKDFDYHNNIFSLTTSIRMGEICIFSCLEDRGAHKEIFADYYDSFKSNPIHPLQFDELSAQITYHNTLLNRTPKFLTIQSENENDYVVVSPPLQGYTTAPIYDDWNPEEYCKFLHYNWKKWGIKKEDILLESGTHLTFLEKEDGSINILDKDGNEI